MFFTTHEDFDKLTPNMVQELNNLVGMIPELPEGVEPFDEEFLTHSVNIYHTIGKFGYSVAVANMSNQMLDEERAKNGIEPTTDEDKAQYPYGLYTYALLGREYETRGNHPCPIMPTPFLSLWTALFNVLRGEVKHQTGAYPEEENEQQSETTGPE